jgi:hypothetical protein
VVVPDRAREHRVRAGDLVRREPGEPEEASERELVLDRQVVLERRVELAAEDERVRPERERRVVLQRQALRVLRPAERVERPLELRLPDRALPREARRVERVVRDARDRPALVEVAVVERVRVADGERVAAGLVEEAGANLAPVAEDVPRSTPSCSDSTLNSASVSFPDVTATRSRSNTTRGATKNGLPKASGWMNSVPRIECGPNCTRFRHSAPSSFTGRRTSSAPSVMPLPPVRSAWLEAPKRRDQGPASFARVSTTRSDFPFFSSSRWNPTSS